MTEQQIREQFANDLKARLSFYVTISGYLTILTYSEIEKVINETLKQVIPTEEEIKKMEE